MLGPNAACASLPFEDAVAMFYPKGDGGLLRRSSRWPLDDSHADARAQCGHCPVLAHCLRDALADDAHTFRALSPEERAAFGGRRQKSVRGREPYLSPSEVLMRIIDSGYDLDAAMEALIVHDRKLDAARTEQGGLSAEWGVWAASVGWSEGLPLTGWTEDAVRDLIVARWGGVTRRRRRSPKPKPASA